MLRFLAILLAFTMMLPSRGAADEWDKVREAVKERLKDPESAQFRKFRKVSDGEICGEVNAKNSYGGYTGFSAFIYFVKDDRAIIDQIAVTLCR